MNVSYFLFVTNDVLRQNLDEAFYHIVWLSQLLELDSYDETAKRAFRKTIIIYTASIVEALLLTLLNKKFSESDVTEHYASWKMQDTVELHKLSDTHKIVAGHYKKIKGDGKKKLNLGQIADFLRKKGLLAENLYNQIDALRVLRNEQHIGTHATVKLYTTKDLEEVFLVAREVKALVKNKL